jgi:hypothetical protein
MLQGHIDRAIVNTEARGVDLGSGHAPQKATNQDSRPAHSPAAGDDDDDDDDEAEDNSNTNSTVSEAAVTDMQSPLRRDEVGKLLLLVARAFSTQHISQPQRTLIKSHVCRRAGYLRILLAQSDMTVVMNALGAIGKEASKNGNAKK